MSARRTAVILGWLIAGTASAVTWVAHVRGVRASRPAVSSGPLRFADDILGEKRVGNGSIENILFDRKSEIILYGKGWHGGIADSELNGGAELHIAKFDGSDDRKISDNVREAFLSADGRRTFFVTDHADLFLLQDGTTTAIASGVLRPALSPDGSSIVYQKLPHDWTNGELYDRALGLTVLDLSSRQERRISDRWEDFNPIWTPDGSHIVFFSVNDQGMAAHYSMNTDGSGRKQLTNIGAAGTGPGTVPVPSETPLWSKDGKFIVYESDRQIWVNAFSADYDAIVAARPIAYGKHPEWRVDGRSVTVLVGAGPGENSRAVTVDLAGHLSE